MAEQESRHRRSHRRSPDERRGHRMEDRKRRRRDSSEDGRTRSRRERSRSPQSRRPKDHRDSERRGERQERLPSGSSPNHSRGRDVMRRQHTRGLEGDERGSEKDNQRKATDGGGRRRRNENEGEEEETAQHEFGGRQATQAESQKKEEPNFATSGKLTAETNTYKGVVIKYSEPAEARVPKTRWRLYPFKGDQALPTLYIHRQSAFLIGRDRKIVDLPVDHPSCSKQHAVLQYRLVEHQKEDGTLGRKVKPYVIDLESTNGTYVNNQRIEPARYYELKERDMIKFGFSSREYILLHENSKENLPDDD